ncbi:MAG: TMEM175 family protein [Acidobacteriota bacterium]
MGKASEYNSELTTQRVEAFSDGVFAIAITLLILEIKIPHLGGTSDGKTLAQALMGLWTSYFAYVVSFITIGIYWANHHYLFKFFKKTDHLFNLLNVFFLMCISFLPFPTAVLAEYMNNPQERHSAVTLYAIGLLLPAFSWFLFWFYGSRNYRLLDHKLAPRFVKLLTGQYLLSILLYLIAVVISLWFTTTGLILCVGLTVLYLLPPKRPIYR